MQPKSYGIVQGGKILFKYGFFQIDNELLEESVNNANTEKLNMAVLELGGSVPKTFPFGGPSWYCGKGIYVMYHEQGSGKGRVQFSVVDDKIVSTVVPTSRKQVLINQDLTITELTEDAVEYLEKYFQDKRSRTFERDFETITFDLRDNADKKKIINHVWSKYSAWVKEVIDKRFIAISDGEFSGVSLHDIVMHLFIGNEYPIQPDGFDRPLRSAEISKAKNDIKSLILQKRAEIENKCFVKSQNANKQDWQLALANVGSWVLKGELLQ